MSIRSLFSFQSIIDLALTLIVLAATYFLFIPWIAVYLSAAAFAIFLTVWLDWFRARRRASHHPWWRSAIPGLYLFGLFGVLAGISNQIVLLLIISLSAIVFYLYQFYSRSIFPKWYEDFFVMLAVLMNFVFIFSLGFFFAWPWWVQLILVFVVSFLLFWPSFHKIREVENYNSLIILLSMIVFEIGWAVLFLPFYYFSNAVILFSAFYLIYFLTGLYLRHNMTVKKVYFHLFLSLIVLIIVLISSPWSYS